MVGENHTGYGEALGYVHLEWVAFSLVGDWAYDCQTYLCIVIRWGIERVRGAFLPARAPLVD